MKIELRNLSHSPANSHETPCFTADLWIDGENYGSVRNSGTGGACIFQSHKAEKLLADYGATLPVIKDDYDSDEHGLPWSADLIVFTLVDGDPLPAPIVEPTQELAVKLAEAFDSELAKSINASDWEEVRVRNISPEYSNACPSHDFCDANQCMIDAFVYVLDGEPHTQCDEHNRLIDNAWMMWREMIKPIMAGERIGIRAEYRDAGDGRFDWRCVESEDRGRLSISPVDIGIGIKPLQRVNTHMVYRLPDCLQK